MSSDVFILSAAFDLHAEAAIRLALELASIKPRRVEDAIFGFDQLSMAVHPAASVRQAGLSCPTVSVSSSIRALFFAAASILSDSIQLELVVGENAAGAAAFLLAAPASVGRLNLLPRARLAAHSLSGPQAALQLAGLSAADVTVRKSGGSGAQLLFDALAEMDERSERWSLITVGQAALLAERI